MPCILRSKKSKRYRRNVSWRKMFNLDPSPDQELAEQTRGYVYQGLIAGYNVYMRQGVTRDEAAYAYLCIAIVGDNWYIGFHSHFLTPSQLESDIEEHIRMINDVDDDSEQ